MREHWIDSTIGDLCEVIAGQSPAGEYYNQEGIGLPFYQGKKEFGQKFIDKPQTWTRKTTKEAELGDILMSVRAPVGPINFATEKICIGRGLAAIKAGIKIDRYFLFYGLLFKQNEIIGNEGAVFASINKNQIESIKFFYPPLPEQKRIVAILDEAFEGIDRAITNTEKNLANSRELFESYLNAIFTQKGEGWAEKKLEYIATFRNGLNFTKSSKGESIKIVGVKDFQNNFWIQENRLDSVTIDAELKEIDILRRGDILTVRSNGNKELIGRCVLAGKIFQKTSHSGFTIRIRIESENIYPQFIVYSLKSRHIRKQLIESGGGISISSLNQQGLSLIKLSFPNFVEQKTIVANIDELAIETQRLESIYRQKIAALNELKQSILQKAFTGELTADTAKTAKEGIAA